MDVVKDSGVVQIHGVDDGTRIKVADWRELRYISAGLMKLPPLCVMVKLKGEMEALGERIWKSADDDHQRCHSVGKFPGDLS